MLARYLDERFHYYILMNGCASCAPWFVSLRNAVISFVLRSIIVFALHFAVAIMYFLEMSGE